MKIFLKKLCTTGPVFSMTWWLRIVLIFAIIISLTHFILTFRQLVKSSTHSFFITLIIQFHCFHNTDLNFALISFFQSIRSYFSNTIKRKAGCLLKELKIFGANLLHSVVGAGSSIDNILKAE